MTGYPSKKAAAQDKLNNDDDTQVYGDELTIAYQSGYYDGKKAAQRPWVGLTDDEVYKIAFTLEGEHWKKIANAIESKLKDKNK
jgi:hypothetical protein